MMTTLDDYLYEPKPEKASDYKWTKNADGQDVPPERQSAFIEWLVSDVRKPETEKEWAAENGISPATLTNWKKNRKFREEWERQALDRNISVETTQDVMRTIIKSAKRGDVTSAKHYMNWVERMLPPKQIERDESISHLSDEELETEIRRLLDDG